MRRGIVAVCALLVVSGSASAQIPWGAFHDLGRPADGLCYDEGYHCWVGAEYLGWWTNHGPINGPLVTSGTTPALGGDGLDYGLYNGIRATVGGWFTCGRSVGFEASGFWFGRRNTEQTVSSDATGSPALAVPFPRADLGGTPFIISDPALGQTGSATLASTSQLWGADAHMLTCLCRGGCWEVDCLFGFQYTELKEDLTFSTTSTVATTSDTFAARNQFYGGQVGLKVGVYSGRCSWELIGKVGLGNTHRVLDATGENSILTQPTAFGHQTSDEFGIIPQAIMKVGFELFPNIHIGAGYNFLYWNSVVRPGSQINPGAAAQFNTSDFIAHGFSASLEWKY